MHSVDLFMDLSGQSVTIIHIRRIKSHRFDKYRPVALLPLYTSDLLNRMDLTGADQ